MSTTISTYVFNGVSLGPGSYLTVTSAGHVGGPAYGVFADASTVTNNGYIRAGSIAVLARYSTVTNNGIISGYAIGTYNYPTNVDSATVFARSSTVINSSTGLIGGGNYDGIYALGGTVTNSGTISSLKIGVAAANGCTITNSGTIDGGFYGVSVGNRSTVTNSGTISGGSAAVVTAAGSTLNVLSGAVFDGKVKDDGTGVLLLGGTMAGMLDMGGSFTGFENISFGSAAWTLEGTTSELASGETISGFTFGDTIDLDGFTATSETYVSGTGLELGNGTSEVTIGLAGNFSGDTFSFSNTSNGTAVEVMCFLAGTRIATADGEKPVESLRAGDLVLDPAGKAAAVRWLGISTVATRFADPLRSMMPIRIKAGALGDELPRRDLLVSPAHAMYFAGILIQAGAMVNGVSIVHEPAMPERFCYYHVETETHQLILAEGAETETFVDNADRMNFDNWAEHEALYGHEVAIAEMDLPRAKSARQIPPALHRQLAARAAALGGMALSA
jgi:hypothetical protein